MFLIKLFPQLINLVFHPLYKQGQFMPFHLLLDKFIFHSNLLQALRVIYLTLNRQHKHSLINHFFLLFYKHTTQRLLKLILRTRVLKFSIKLISLNFLFAYRYYFLSFLFALFGWLFSTESFLFPFFYFLCQLYCLQQILQHSREYFHCLQFVALIIIWQNLDHNYLLQIFLLLLPQFY